MNPLTVGMRVQTPLGLATIIGFERFGRGRPGHWDYVPSDLVQHDNGGRVACKLDEPERWSFSAQGATPYIFRSQLSGLE